MILRMSLPSTPASFVRGESRERALAFMLPRTGAAEKPFDHRPPAAGADDSRRLQRD